MTLTDAAPPALAEPEEAQRLARDREAFLAAVPRDRDAWVFGYGSLLWNPGFDYREAQPARLHGFHRAFCIYSHHYRGTVERPGLVLGLDRGGSCHGLAFRVPAAAARDALAYLWDREMVSAVYRPHAARVRLQDGPGTLSCHTFVADRRHRQYAGSLTPQEVARLVHRGIGSSGANRAYLDSTLAQLARLGMRDRRLAEIQAALHAIDAKGD